MTPLPPPDPAATAGARHIPSPGARYALRTLYYLAVLLALVVLYGRGDFSTSGFIYQAF